MVYMYFVKNINAGNSDRCEYCPVENVSRRFLHTVSPAGHLEPAILHNSQRVSIFSLFLTFFIAFFVSKTNTRIHTFRRKCKVKVLSAFETGRLQYRLYYFFSGARIGSAFKYDQHAFMKMSRNLCRRIHDE